MIKQDIIKRNSKTVDEGTMGFHDYVTHKEPIDYPTEDLAIIVYKEKK